MSAVDEIKQRIASLSADNKRRLMESFGHGLDAAISGIESDPHISGGEARIIRTRISVWLLEQARRLGSSEADLLRNYPALRAEDLAHAWAYVRAHPDEIDRDIHENEAA